MEAKRRFWTTLFLCLWLATLAADTSSPQAEVFAWPSKRVPLYSFESAERVGSLGQFPAPGWVSEVSYTAEERRSDTEAAMLLIDKQVHIGTDTVYSHFVRRLDGSEDEDDVPQALIEVRYFPQWQKIAWHTLVIKRRGRTFDRLGMAAFHQAPVIWNSTGHEHDAQTSIVAFMDDLKEGDILEYSYSIQGSLPALREHFVDSFALQYPYSVGRIFYRLVGDPGQYPYIREHHIARPTHGSQVNDTQTEWVWNDQHVTAYTPEPDAPSWHKPIPWIQISDFRDWADVAVWGHSLFALPEKPSRTVQNIAERIARSSDTPKQRVLAALHHVQEGLAQPEHLKEIPLHDPVEPTAVLRRGWGDQWDKAHLLCCILHQLDIEAHPALVSSWLKHRVATWHPSPQPFNHAIVQIRLDGNTYWVDPTIQYQGGDLELSRCSRYQHALVLLPQTRGLSSIHSSSPKHLVDVATTYVVSSKETPAQLLVTTTLRGEEADEMRRRLAHEGKGQILAQFQHTYGQVHGSLEPTSIGSVVDNREQGEIIFSEHYLLENPWEVTAGSKQKTLCIPALYLANNLPRLDDTTSTTPIGIEHPTSIRETVSIVLSDHKWKTSPQNHEWHCDALTLQTRQSVRGDTLVHATTYNTHEDHIDAEDIDEVRATLMGAQQVLFHHITVPAYIHRSRWKSLLAVGLVCCFAGGASLWLRRRHLGSPKGTYSSRDGEQ